VCEESWWVNSVKEVQNPGLERRLVAGCQDMKYGRLLAYAESCVILGTFFSFSFSRYTPNKASKILTLYQ